MCFDFIISSIRSQMFLISKFLCFQKFSLFAHEVILFELMFEFTEIDHFFVRLDLKYSPSIEILIIISEEVLARIHPEHKAK